MSDLLRDVYPRVGIDKPPADVRAAINAVAEGAANGPQQQRFYRFVVHELCRVGSAAMALPAESAVQNWRAGLRYAGLFLEEVRRLPLGDPSPEPAARTMTERQDRRRRSTTQS